MLPCLAIASYGPYPVFPVHSHTEVYHDIIMLSKKSSAFSHDFYHSIRGHQDFKLELSCTSLSQTPEQYSQAYSKPLSTVVTSEMTSQN